VDHQNSEPNPYASNPISERALTPQETRAIYFPLESKLRSAGAIFFFPSIFGLLAAVSVILNGVYLANQPNQSTASHATLLIGLGIGLACIACYLFVICERLRCLSPKARKPAIVIFAIGLLGFPLGTLASIYLLSLLLGERGQFVFSEQYKTLQSQTPELKYRQTGLDWFKAIMISFCYFGGLGSLIAGLAVLIQRDLL